MAPLHPALRLLPLAAVLFSSLAAAAEPRLDAGRCVGAGPPSAPITSGPPYEKPIAEVEAGYWRLLGYKVDRSGRLLDGQDRPVSEAEVRRMREPFDASTEALDENIWKYLKTQGMRLDEATCRFLAPDGEPVSRLEIAAYRGMHKKDFEHQALANLKLLLKGHDPQLPVPSRIIDRIKTLEKAGVELPPALRQLLFGAQAPKVGELSGLVDSAYLNSTRFFDGQRAFSGLLQSALPVSGWTRPAPDTGYAAPLEERLGQRLAVELEARFACAGPGRELLEHYRGQDGTVRLPPILILKLSQRPPGDAAAIASNNGGLVQDSWQAAAVILASLPTEERDRRAKEFSDKKLFLKYLLDHPEARGRLLDETDEIFFHELIHVWQGRRDDFNVEMVRDNIAGVNPMSDEHEAYREDCRYFLDKVSREPSLLRQKAYMADRCLPMLVDYDSFRDGISRQYLSTFAGSQEFSDVAELQRQRVTAARKLAGESAFSWLVQKLKLAGFSRGEEALKLKTVDVRAREKDFVKSKLPSLRREVVDGLAENGRPDMALRILQSAPALDDDKPRWVRAISQTEALLIYDHRKLSLQERNNAFCTLRAVLQPGKSWSWELFEAARRDVRLFVPVLLESAQAEPNRENKDGFFKMAEAWCEYLPPDDPLRERVRQLKRESLP
ncbi:MAG: hypothetical protein PHF00_08660 [Elusimicrobia bacterium]|nr:hypothetical protein [Elusimicrobiota bacterium]